MNHAIELSEYATAAYVECIVDMIRLMTDRGIKAVVSVLMKAKNSYGPPVSLSQTTRVELPECSLITGDDQEARS